MRGAFYIFQFTAINEFDKFCLQIRDSHCVGGVFEASYSFSFSSDHDCRQMLTALQLCTDVEVKERKVQMNWMSSALS